MSTSQPDTEKAVQFLAGKNITDVLKTKNAISRNSAMKCFMVFTELQSLNKVPNWTDTKRIGDKCQISICRVNILSKASVSYTHLRAHETRHDLVCRLLLEKK